MAQVVRLAIREYKEREEKLSFEELLQKTQGLWAQGDGLKHQEKIRSEWND